MSVPNFINDGDWSVALQNGPATWSLPFELQGDTQSFEYRAMFRQSAANYVPLQNTRNLVSNAYYSYYLENMQTLLTSRGLAYLIEEGESRDIGCGILEFPRTYASIPATRYEGTSIVYPMQFYSLDPGYTWADPPADPTVTELPLPLDARIKYEYSLTPFSTIAAPKVEVFYKSVLKFGGWGTLVAGNEYLAEDSETGIYKGGIFYRKGTYFIWPVITIS